ncbi:MAG: hypothetical protein LBT59_03090 [Clostridiales bacterium]|jgi:hypothetical protein|nr:hypothetical protein [Clostridiales bacterium]
MKGLVELNEMETREVKGGASFISVLSGLFSIVKSAVPVFQSIIGQIVKLF